MNRLVSITSMSLLLGFLAGIPVGADALGGSDKLSDELQAALEAPIRARISELIEEKNADGIKHKRGVYSRYFKKVDDETYAGTLQINTAGPDTMTTERLELTLKRESKEKWTIAGEEVKDTYDGMHRGTSAACYPFESFRFEREGMTMTASKGGMCEGFWKGTVSGYVIMADDLEYDYQIPDHVKLIRQSHDYYDLHRIVSKDHSHELDFKPQRVGFSCDPQTCEELIAESFTGLSRVSPEERHTFEGTRRSPGIPEQLLRYSEKLERDTNQAREERAFAHFRRPYQDDNRRYTASVYKHDDHVLGVKYNNWGGYEVAFFIYQQTTDPEAMQGDVFGYYTEETLKSTDPYELERRDDEANRLYEVYKISGEVEAGVEDPELVKADINIGLTVKRPTRELPFVILNAPRGDDESYRRPTLFVNAIQRDGQEMTWVKTSAYGGFVVLPEEAAPGDKVNLRIDFSTRAIRKVNHAFSQMARFGWMPFVRFADFIDEFELTIKTPAKYTILGIGHKVSEKKQGDVLVSHWKSDSPVVFPTVIFGKYMSAKPGFDAKKADGTVIPVEVHVDEVSMMHLKDANTSISDFEEAKDVSEFVSDLASGARGIRGKQLKSIAEQAANSINLYREISGVDYPYGALNLVNDPSPALYGQAPSSLIYLGSFVFRGEGTMAGGGGLTGDIFAGGGGTGISKFLKSVTAHEVGHQWWGSRVSNANGRNYWFVESLAEYFSALYLEFVFGKKEYDEQVDEWRRNILNANMKASVQEASALWAGEGGFRPYQSAVYNKGPYAFHILRQTFGDEKFFPFLKQFSQELVQKREIVTRDIQVAAEKALGGVDPEGNPYNVDLEWFFDQWIRGVGLPQFAFDYALRETEDGGWLIEGSIKQRIVVGNKRDFQVVDNKHYRGVVHITATGSKGQEFTSRIIIDGTETPFRLKVPEKPVEVALNKQGGMLSHDVLINQGW